MRKNIMRAALGLSAFFLILGQASAQLSRIDGSIIKESAPQNAPPKNRVGDQITLRTLDKVTANTQDFTIKVGESLKFASLTIDVKHCEVKPPEAIPETFAFLQIFEPPKLTQKERARLQEAPEPVKLFSGWMLASKPAVSALDHGVYDVWVVGCNGGEIN